MGLESEAVAVSHIDAASLGLTLKHWGMIFRSVFRKINLLFLFFVFFFGGNSWLSGS